MNGGRQPLLLLDREVVGEVLEVAGGRGVVAFDQAVAPAVAFLGLTPIREDAL